MCTLAYSYTRMSTERQQRGDSLRRQLDWSAAFAQRNNLVLDDSLRDIGVSAWKGKHRKKGALGEFLRMVEEGLIPRGSYLLIESLDRLSREQVMDALDLFRNILRQGITIATMDPEQVYTLESVNREFSQLLIALTFMSRANEESERKSSRVKQAFRTKRELAHQGHKTNSSAPMWLNVIRVDRNTFRYELNEHAATVRRIFEMSADGMGVDAISRALNRDGVPTFRPSPRGWWPTKVNNVLTRRSTIGELQHTELVGDTRRPLGEAIPDYYPAVVDADLFLRAQKQPTARKAGRKGENFTNLLGELARCAHCNGRMLYRNAANRVGTSKTYHYMICSVGGRDGACSQGVAQFHYNSVEQCILDHIREFGFRDVLRMQSGNQQLHALDQQLAHAMAEVDVAFAREANLTEAVEQAQDAQTIALLVNQLAKRVAERQQAEEQRGTLQRARDVMAVQQGNEDPTDLIASLREEWQTTDDVTQRYRLRSRCNSALARVLEYVDFDSVANTYRVHLLGHYRVYEFDNVKCEGDVSPTPRNVNSVPFRRDMLNPDNEALDLLERVAVTGSANILDGAAELFVDSATWQQPVMTPEQTREAAIAKYGAAAFTGGRRSKPDHGSN